MTDRAVARPRTALPLRRRRLQGDRRARPPRQRASGALARWEVLLLADPRVLVLVGRADLAVLPRRLANFANLDQRHDGGRDHGPAMTLIIITGEIDLSVESMVGLSGAVLGGCGAGVPLEIGIPIVLVVGVLGGLFNGLLVTRGWPAVPGRHPRDAGPLPRPGQRRPGHRRREQLPVRVHRVRLRQHAGHADPVDAARVRHPRRRSSRS